MNSLPGQELLLTAILEVSGDDWSQGENFKRSFASNCCASGGDTVCDPELVNKVIVEKTFVGLFGKDAMGDEARYLRCAHLLQRLGAFKERRTALHQIVNDDDMLSARIALGDLHNASITITNLVADDQVESCELRFETFVSSVIWEGNRNAVTGKLFLQLPDRNLEQPHRGLELHQNVVREVELLLQCVNVVYDDCWWTRWRNRSC
mmetsp:Transcript_4221/g.11924  ORF Transcript_4221/g.11924 Transcript_4221/m.11924 type:complete len:207 (-) Transcript_4221:455-1075(-)